MSHGQDGVNHDDGAPNGSTPSIYLDHEFPVRPTRTSAQPRHVRLLGTRAFARLRSADDRDIALRLPATVLLEATESGETLRSVEYTEIPIREETWYRNQLVCGSTGSRKTFGYFYPAIDAVLRSTSGSVCLLNIKGPTGTAEIRALAERHRPNAPVIVFAPASPASSVVWNPVTFAKRYGMRETLIEALICARPDFHHESKYWENTARKAVSSALRHASIDSPAAVHDLFDTPQALRDLARALNDPTLTDLASSMGTGSVNAATALTDIIGRLYPFVRSDAIRAVLSGRNELDLIGLLRAGEPFTLIIEANESTFANDRHSIALFLSMLFQSIVRVSESNGGELPCPLSLFLDEFGAVGRIQDAETVANTSRSRKASIHVAVQTLAQLEHHYGDAARSLLAAFNSKMFILSGLELADREYASRLSGFIDTERWRVTQQLDPSSGEFHTVTRTQEIMRRPLLMPDELSMPPHPVFGPLAVQFSPDHPPALLHLTPAWEIPHIEDAISGVRSTVRACLARDTEAIERELGSEEASPMALGWWTAQRKRFDRHPEAFARLVADLERRAATIEELYMASKMCKGDSLATVLAYMEYRRAMRRESVNGTPPSAPRAHGSSARTARDEPLFTSCPRCRGMMPRQRSVCLRCENRAIREPSE